MRKQEFYPKCINNHNAAKLCLEESCKQSAIICEQKLQNCEKTHPKCDINISIQGIQRKLFDQGFEEIDAQVLKFFDKIIKMINIKKEEYIEIMDTPQRRLKGDQEKLYNLLKQGPAKELFPQFILSTIKEVPKIKEQALKSVEKLNIKITQSLNQIQSILNSFIRLNIDNKQPKPGVALSSDVKTEKIEFKFVKQLHYSNYQIKNNTIKVIKSDDEAYRFALIHPPLDGNGISPKTINLKIINSGENNLWLGAAHYETINKNKFSIDTKKMEEYGAYIIRGNSGTIYNSHSLKPKQSKYCDMRFSTGDIVSITYDKDKQVLAFYNKTKLLVQELNFVHIKRNRLHFCIWADVPNTQVQII